MHFYLWVKVLPNCYIVFVSLVASAGVELVYVVQTPVSGHFHNRGINPVSLLKPQIASVLRLISYSSLCAK